MARLHLDSPGAFFPPLQDGDETPEFVRWAIDYACSPREQHVGNNLERVFRQLRPLAALGDAMRESRLTPYHRAFACERARNYEFDAMEILSFYGARVLTEVPCLTCPVNASSDHFPNCIGIISRTSAIEPFIDALGSAFEMLSTLIPVTSPRWYGFWAESPLQGKRLRNSASVVDTVLARLKITTLPLAALQSAMHTACERNVPFHVQLHPPGAIRAGHWEIPDHCGYCGGLRVPRQRVCKICHREKAWKSAEKRHLLGIRPFREVKPDG